MRERPLLLAAVAVMLAALGILLSLAAPPRRSKITQENCDRIREGMTEAEVEAVLGGPPGIHTERPVTLATSGGYYRPRYWVGDEGVVSVWFDHKTPNRVRFAMFTSRPPEPITERVRRRWGWLTGWLFGQSWPAC